MLAIWSIFPVVMNGQCQLSGLVIKVKGKVTLFNVGSSVSSEAQVSMETDSVPFTPHPLLILHFGVFKAIATKIRGKAKQTLASPRIELRPHAPKSAHFKLT